MGAGLRFAGQEAVLSFVDTTTGDAILPDIAIASIDFDFPFELTKKEYIGEIGPDFREFADGWTAAIKFDPNNAAQFVTYVGLLKAKAEGASTDEFAIQLKFTAPDAGAFNIQLRDAHFENGGGGSLSGRTDFLASGIKAKGKTYKIATA